VSRDDIWPLSAWPEDERAWRSKMATRVDDLGTRVARLIGDSLARAAYERRADERLERMEATLAQVLAHVSPPVTKSEAAEVVEALERMQRTVLVIEDDQDIADAYKEIVLARGYRYHHAKTAEQATSLLDAHGLPDLVILDIALAGAGDGFDAFSEIRSRPGGGNVAVYVASSVLSPAVRKELEARNASTHGILRFLAKGPEVLAHLSRYGNGTGHRDDTEEVGQ
jgi:CheY-like chemotaxis protein